MAKLMIWLYVLMVLLMPMTVLAIDLGTPRLTEPLQQEKFFNAERFAVQGGVKEQSPLLQPQLGVSHDAREEEKGVGMKQTTHRIHGEAGGRINFFSDVTFTAVAKIPVYTYAVTGSDNVGNGAANSAWLQSPRRLSWRSELGVPLKEGVDLNLFYDRSAFGRIDRPGVDEREEKFGTQFIFRFK